MQRFWNKVDKQEFCWIWTAYLDEKGYGRFQLEGKWRTAHRVSYEMVKGPIPIGLEIDHLCKNKACVNPAHLEPVHPRINSHRSHDTIAFRNSSKTHCPNGHPLLADNLIVSKNGYNGARRCRKCKNQQERLRDRAKRPQTRKYQKP